MTSHLFSQVIAPAPRYMLRLNLLHRLFKQHLPQTDFSAIEFGPGLGDVSFFLAQKPHCRGITLVDFSEQTLKLLEQRFSDFDDICYLRQGIDELSLDKHYDVLLAFEVLEHIVEDEKALRKIYQLLNPAGQFFMSVPAYQSKWQKQDEYAGHVRRYEREELQQKLTNAGFSDVEIFDYGFPLTSIMYPFKQASYKPNTETTLEERSAQSGIDRPFFSRIPLALVLPIYLPFLWLQDLFINRDLGDGFIAIAKKT